MDNILKEEINKQLKRLDKDESKRFKRVINELFLMKTDDLADNIGSVEKDGNNEIASENWNWLLDMIATSIVNDESSWNEYFKKRKLEILTNMYFTKRNGIKQENLQTFIKINIKPYFTALQNYTDVHDFKNKFFGLPSDIAFCLVRFCFFVNEELKNNIKVSSQELRSHIIEMRELRLKVAENIAHISKGYKNILDFQEVITLYDNGLLVEDNYVNRGITEFISKLILDDQAKGKLLDFVSNAIIKNIDKNIKSYPSYMNHLNDIKMELDTNYFSSSGEQLGKKFDNYIELTTGGDYDGYVVDGDSVFKEPQKILNPINNAGGVLPGESGEGVDTGGSDLASAGGGGNMGGGMPTGGLDGDLPGGDFAPEGSEGEIPGIEDDGVPMPEDGDGLPEEFGTVEDNEDETPDDTEK